MMQHKDAGKVIQHKCAAFELKQEPGEDGTFSGYASVFGNVDHGMDIVQRGAFARSLASGRKVRMLWQHDPSKVIGVWDEIKEDDRGLFVRGRVLSDVNLGREAMALLRADAIDSMSIGFRTVEATEEDGGRVRKLVEVDLWEISLVTFPMNTAATVTDVKSIRTEREFEAFLREAGYSRKEAAALTLHGFKAITGQRDAGQVDAHDEGLSSLAKQIRQLQEKTQCLERKKST